MHCGMKGMYPSICSKKIQIEIKYLVEKSVHLPTGRREVGYVSGFQSLQSYFDLSLNGHRIFCLQISGVELFLNSAKRSMLVLDCFDLFDVRYRNIVPM